MSSQFPPWAPRSEHAVLMSVPTMADVLEVVGVNWQLRAFSRQLHAASLGVGGSVVDALNVEFSDGQPGYAVDPALLWLGASGGVTLAYCSCRRVKSLLTVTVLFGFMVTIPNCPAALLAGK